MTRPLDPATPVGRRAEEQINDVLAGVITRLRREGKPLPTEAATTMPRRKRGVA